MRTRGLVYFSSLMPPLVLKKYSKPAKAPSDLLTHLESRGLTIMDRPAALRTLETIGYYRLLIYMRPLQGPGKIFIPGTTFDSVVQLYRFDRDLRLLCLDAIEQIEVALRAAIVNELGVPYGPHFYLAPEHFESATVYRGFFNKAVHADYLAIRHYQARYNDPPHAPIWAICEAVTFGALSHLYSGLNLANRKRVAKPFAFGESVLVSWFRTLNDLRNICAHHNRLWNATLIANKPMRAKVVQADLSATAQERFYGRAIVIVSLLSKIDPGSTWKGKLKRLLASYLNVPLQEMGFPPNWAIQSIWL